MQIILHGQIREQILSIPEQCAGFSLLVWAIRAESTSAPPVRIPKIAAENMSREETP
jgi:hypothetical protein